MNELTKSTEVVAKLVELLTPFSSDERQRVVRATLTLAYPVNAHDRYM